MLSRKFLSLSATLACGFFSTAAVQGFSVSNPTTITTKTSPKQLQHHYISEIDEDVSLLSSLKEQVAKNYAHGLLVVAVTSCLFVPQLAMAVSGGGLDYANLDITGQDFSNEPKAYKGKDFTQVRAIFLYAKLQDATLSCVSY